MLRLRRVIHVEVLYMVHSCFCCGQALSQFFLSQKWQSIIAAPDHPTSELLKQTVDMQT